MDHAGRSISVHVDASTHCQLRCPSCPTAQGLISQTLGSGFLDPSKLAKLLDENPSIAHLELSNWGEIFLNPRLEEIARVAFERNVVLTASNGVNLNHARPSALEAVVRYRVLQITVSIDGASQETYQRYRIGGSFHRVIDNIEVINDVKRKHKSPFPILLWQFIAFGHNKSEIEMARKHAERLGMHFYVKLAWDDFSPVRNEELVRSATKGGASTRDEYQKVHSKSYNSRGMCLQLWERPQINFDGELLGCCTNRWGSLGNVFEDGLMGTIHGEKMRYAKRMVTGQAEPRNDIPCTQCHHYHRMREENEFLQPNCGKTILTQGAFYEAVRRFCKPLVRCVHRSRVLSNWVVKPVADSIISRLVG